MPRRRSDVPVTEWWEIFGKTVKLISKAVNETAARYPEFFMDIPGRTFPLRTALMAVVLPKMKVWAAKNPGKESEAEILAAAINFASNISEDELRLALKRYLRDPSDIEKMIEAYEKFKQVLPEVARAVLPTPA